MNERKSRKPTSKSWFIDSSDSDSEVSRPSAAAVKSKKRPLPTASSQRGKRTAAGEAAATGAARNGEDAKKIHSENVYHCVICGKDITALSVALREAHVNACIDEDGS